MRAYDIIAKKRDGGELTAEEIRFFIHGFAKGKPFVNQEANALRSGDEESLDNGERHCVTDYQAAAWAMAVFLRGMTEAETAALTEAMVTSGETVDLSPIPGIKVDKHSTGGVGDTTTLILAPLVAAMGIPVAKMSGRGLGHTGGTLDKLESIPGLSIDLSREKFLAQVKDIHVAVAGQTANLVPADQKLYALRDVTATVESIPLIASSVMSKKLAAGADAILLDVKVGRGAFMKNQDDAKELARAMVAIGNRLGRRTAALLTAMEQPLGNAVGNALEVAEAIAILANRDECGFGPISADLRTVTLELAARLAWMAGKADSVEAGLHLAETTLTSGAALERFRRFVAAQGGDSRVADAPETLLPQASIRQPVRASHGGLVTALDAMAVGRAAALLGAGRQQKGDPIDPAVGVVIHKRIGDTVKAGDVLAEVFANDSRWQAAAQAVSDAYAIGPGGEEENGALAPLPLILGEVH
ncbi:pyrimidine-nucleoside phosphorylase [Heliomicrobium modesticaldum Ice1]|uniref:Pyrimidine-nucleoside phosphorylase n=1 Tax=Heliobacterium modesticaldum (strain ATCC 51547 / Ice1) TaxID=498761 RepID=B0TEL6_HELMI|nr:thymidine phosphorylase [Heliomicrobium modesticaldum]ABZ82935.1 pyrimidine-nucleoside phosphorylase [Heliomicrobium modesticaldum Ice1]